MYFSFNTAHNKLVMKCLRIKWIPPFHKSHKPCIISFGMKHKQTFQFSKTQLQNTFCAVKQLLTTMQQIWHMKYKMNSLTSNLCHNVNPIKSSNICWLPAASCVTRAFLLTDLCMKSWSEVKDHKQSSSFARSHPPAALARHSHAVGVCLMNEWGGVQSEVLKHPRQVSDQSAN